MNTDNELDLKVRSRADVLLLEVINIGEKPVRLWNQDNSWGWEMPHISVCSENNDYHFQLAPGARLWTRNFPAFTELKPREVKVYRLRSSDFDPEMLLPVQKCLSERILVQAQLIGTESPEQSEHNVWFGLVQSYQQLLEPPHPWLSTI